MPQLSLASSKSRLQLECGGSSNNDNNNNNKYYYCNFYYIVYNNNNNNNLLLTEREGCTGEYWPEVVTVRTERSEVRTKTTEGQYSPVQPEQARLVSSLLYGTLFLACT